MTSTTGLRETLEPKALADARSAAMRALGYTHGDTVRIGNIPLNIGGAVEAGVSAYLSASMAGPVPEGVEIGHDEAKLWKSLAIVLEVYNLDPMQQRHVLAKVQNLVSAVRARAPALPEAKPVAIKVYDNFRDQVQFETPDRARELDYAGDPERYILTLLYASPVQVDREGLEKAAKWHDQRARDTPDAFEMEFHQASATAIRSLRTQP